MGPHNLPFFTGVILPSLQSFVKKKKQQIGNPSVTGG